MSTSTFFVTVMKGESSAWPKNIGMYDLYQWAEKVILENEKGIQKDYTRYGYPNFYTHASIDEIEFGNFQCVKNRWLFEWNDEFNQFELTHVEPQLDDPQSLTSLF